ncbi:hypothetical protein ACWCQS_45820 [Streptomyces sp. NPDC002076]
MPTVPGAGKTPAGSPTANRSEVRAGDRLSPGHPVPAYSSRVNRAYLRRRRIRAVIPEKTDEVLDAIRAGGAAEALQ